MFKKIIAAVISAALLFGFASCNTDGQFSGSGQSESTTVLTKIYNSFKDVLPSFGFDSTPVEKYEEGLSYSFSAKCSSKKFEKYIKKVKENGFTNRAAEDDGYFSAYNAEKYYVEITLVNENITVFVKRT